MTRGKLQLFLHHEVGTHVIRRINEEFQPWNMRRAKFNLHTVGKSRAGTGIEEGLASLNELCEHPTNRLLVGSALNYYVAFMGSMLPFR